MGCTAQRQPMAAYQGSLHISAESQLQRQTASATAKVSALKSAMLQVQPEAPEGAEAPRTSSKIENKEPAAHPVAGHHILRPASINYWALTSNEPRKMMSISTAHSYKVPCAPYSRGASERQEMLKLCSL